MFLLYHSEGCNICEMEFHKCYINDLRTTTCSGILGHRTLEKKYQDECFKRGSTKWSLPLLMPSVTMLFFWVKFNNRV
jgi:hypothetical protein